MGVMTKTITCPSVACCTNAGRGFEIGFVKLSHLQMCPQHPSPPHVQVTPSHIKYSHTYCWTVKQLLLID